MHLIKSPASSSQSSLASWRFHVLVVIRLLTKHPQLDSKKHLGQLGDLQHTRSSWKFDPFSNPRTIIMSIRQWMTPLRGIDSLRQTEAPMPSLGAGEVLVEIRAVSLNYRDVEGEYDLGLKV